MTQALSRRLVLRLPGGKPVCVTRVYAVLAFLWCPLT